MLLERGLTFVPRPTTFDQEELQRDIHKYHRRLKILDYFDYTDSDTHLPFINPSTWEPKLSQVDHHIRTLIKTDRRTLRDYHTQTDRQDNLTTTLRESINTLKNNPHIVIKPADKGSKIVILDNHQYIFEANRQLGNTQHYKPIQDSIQPHTQVRLRTIIKSLYERRYITAKQRDYLYGPDTPRQRLFYLLPKIHKEPDTWTIPFEVPPGRPIVSDCNSESYNISEYIDHYINPLSTHHPSYLKDTYHFLEKLKPIAVPSHTHIFTIDVDSLYTNINTTMGVQAVRSLFQQHPDNNRPDQDILQLLQISLDSNDFLFNNKQYLQTSGTAMGKKFAPAYANIYMAEWEREALSKCPLQPSFYYRFLDDIIGAWPHDIKHFTEFINILNSHHPSITVKYIIDPQQIHFLDTTVYFQPINTTHKSLQTRVYFKPTDTHALLHKHSYHPKHTFKGIVKSQIIRFHRISSHKEDLHIAISTLFHALRHRGYSKRFLRTIKNDTLAALSPTQPTRTHTPTTPLIGTQTTKIHTTHTPRTTPALQIQVIIHPQPAARSLALLSPSPSPPKPSPHPTPGPYPVSSPSPPPSPKISRDSAATPHPTLRHYPIFNLTHRHSPKPNLPFNPTPLPLETTPSLAPYPNPNPLNPTPKPNPPYNPTPPFNPEAKPSPSPNPNPNPLNPTPKPNPPHNPTPPFNPKSKPFKPTPPSNPKANPSPSINPNLNPSFKVPSNPPFKNPPNPPFKTLSNPPFNPTTPPHPHPTFNSLSLTTTTDTPNTSDTTTDALKIIIPLVTTFSHKTRPLQHALKHNFTTSQHTYPALKPYRIISAYRKNKSLKDILIHTKFSTDPPPPAKPHTLHYRHRKFITNPHSHTSAPVPNNLTLQTSNVVYIITCTRCYKHYVGETGASIETRLKQHLNNISRAHLTTTLVTHFQEHPVTHLIISGVESGSGWSSGQRKHAERHWITQLNTIAPLGLNEKT